MTRDPSAVFRGAEDSGQRDSGYRDLGIRWLSAVGVVLLVVGCVPGRPNRVVEAEVVGVVSAPP
jgi:hypothetical protein